MMPPLALARTIGGVTHMVDVPERLARAVAERVVALVVEALDVNALLARIDLDDLIAGTAVTYAVS